MVWMRVDKNSGDEVAAATTAAATAGHADNTLHSVHQACEVLADSLDSLLSVAELNRAKAFETRRVRIYPHNDPWEIQVGCYELQPGVFIIAALVAVAELIHFQLQVHVSQVHQEVRAKKRASTRHWTIPRDAGGLLHDVAESRLHLGQDEVFLADL